ncbi:MAG: phosphodiester glycosidase family protein [Candidatus Krumholzibacteriia bacterium]
MSETISALGEAAARAARRVLLAGVAGALLLVSAALPEAGLAETAPEAGWRILEPGLELGVFPAPVPSSVGDSRIRVLRIDPGRFDLRLMNASAPGQGKPCTAREWCRRNDLVAAINASMYHPDFRTSVSLMRTRGHVNNPNLSRDNAVLAFDADCDSLPPVQIIDRRCQGFDALRQRYATLVQSIRMVSCQGRNVWSPQPRKWSTAAIGVDESGRLLFIHARSPYTTHDFIDILLQLPIDLYNAMYVEGGPEAQLFVRSGDDEHEFVGSFETGFLQHDDNRVAWPVPNVVAIVRREAPPE